MFIVYVLTQGLSHSTNRLGSYPVTSSLSRETIRSLVFYALRVWAEPTPLEFHEVRLSIGLSVFLSSLFVLSLM